MAASDYMLCALCGAKAFYDARLNYESNHDADVSAVTLDYCGAVAALCLPCSAAFELVRIPRQAPRADATSVELGAELAPAPSAPESRDAREIFEVTHPNALRSFHDTRDSAAESVAAIRDFWGEGARVVRFVEASQ
jgi:hypothetical protein